MIELHKRHGTSEVCEGLAQILILAKGNLVRIGPNEISVADPAALKVIYGAGSKFSKTA